MVCGFQVKVWESYRTSRSFGYGHGSITELTEVSYGYGSVNRTHRRFEYCGKGTQKLQEVPDTGIIVLQNVLNIGYG